MSMFRREVKITSSNCSFLPCLCSVFSGQWLAFLACGVYFLSPPVKGPLASASVPPETFQSMWLERSEQVQHMSNAEMNQQLFTILAQKAAKNMAEHEGC